ncbi:hypothetical protein [Nonomuraea sp. NPDC050643]|uniref:hypothetical protein n=1 Tax=Nonomuraea sp. NPDC050643 TaxID=3155660 RepID=UPI0033E23F4E
MPTKRERQILNILAFRESLGQSWAVPEPGGAFALVVPSMMAGCPLSRQSGVSAYLLDKLRASGFITMERQDQQPAYNYARPTTGRGAHKVGLTDEGRKLGQEG